MQRFNGRVVLVTGGASGLGEASALRLAAEGAEVVIADVDEANGARVAEHDQISFIATDVGDASAVEHLIAEIVSRHGSLDAVHSNAGIEAPPMMLHQTPDEWFDRLIATNTKGMYLICKHAIRQMLEQDGGGAICCTSSILGPRSFAKAGVYSISKGGVDALVRVLAAEYATLGIRVNAVQPGTVLTPMVKREIEEAEDSDDLRRKFDALQPMKRCAEPAEIASVVAFLLSDDASFMTGAEVAVDGGSLAVLPGPDMLTAEEMGL